MMETVSGRVGGWWSVLLPGGGEVGELEGDGEVRLEKVPDGEEVGAAVVDSGAL